MFINGLGDSLPIVNSWTEFGPLEHVCVGMALNSQYAEPDPTDRNLDHLSASMSKYIVQALGPRPAHRVKKAEEQLQNLVEILQGESISVGTVKELDDDIQEDLLRNRSWLEGRRPESVAEDGRVSKQAIKVCRASTKARFDHEIRTPWFRSQHQVGLTCPRDTVITLGNVILETGTASRNRYFESNYMRDVIYGLWNAGNARVQWKTAPKPTCGDSMYDLSKIPNLDPVNGFAQDGYKTVLNETEVAFDAADMIRVGRDIFYKRSTTANLQGLKWLRREFPDLRFHLVHIPSDGRRHLDTTLTPLRPPTAGSDGILLINPERAPLAAEMELWTRNEWKPTYCPPPATRALSPVALCSENLHMNMLSLSPTCVIIEEAEVAMFHFLEDLGFDVITVPFRMLNEFGGGIHCTTWDIRRRETCTDYFAEQDYQAECERDEVGCSDSFTYPKQ